MKQKKNEGWVMLYKSTDGKVTTSEVFDNKTILNTCTRPSNFLTIARVEWEEVTKDTLEALADKITDEEFKDRVAIAVLPELIKEWPYRHACEHAYDIAQLLLLEKKERNNETI